MNTLPWPSVAINYCAFAVAICRDVDCEEAIDLIVKGKRSVYKPVEEVLEMIRLRETGMSYSEIGKYFGIQADNVFMRIKRYRKREGLIC